MQLKKPARIRHALAAASCTLLGSITHPGRAEENAKDLDLDPASARTHSAQARPLAGSRWEFDTTVLFYSEPDRVSTIKPVINARREIGDDETINLRLTLDTLTGASANGAVAADKVQTFTRPSGNGSYTAQPGETPLDDTFRDTRVALSGSWERPLSRMIRSNLGASVSKEYDYLSIAVNGLLSFDFNMRNTTLQTGLSIAADSIDPEGGIPIPFASMGAVGEVQPRLDGTEDKNTVDLLLGITQVIDKNTIAQLSYSFSNSSGYQTDPFKLLSVVDGGSGETLDYVFERRPEERQKHSIYGGIKHHFTNDIAEASYRLHTDDWGIDSHTLDLKYRWNLGNERYLQPHLRLYRQSEADFYRHSLVSGPGFPEFASADYRLGDFTATTLGLKYGLKFRNGSDFSVRGEYYLQAGDSSPDDAIGVQRDQDLFPDVDAIILQLNYSFRW